MLRNDFRKFQKTYNWSPNVRAFNLAIRALERLLGPFMFGCVMDFDKAVAFMEKDTSPGFPWNIVYKSKRLVLDNEIELIRMIVNQVMKRQPIKFEFHGRVWDRLYMLISPKKEFRPADKVVNPDPNLRKTRTFCACDIILTILSIMIFGEQNDNLLKAHFSTWFKVGMSPYYGGWDRLAINLLHQPYLNGGLCDKFKFLDVAHMEASIREMMMLSIYNLRKSKILFDDDSYDNIFDFVTQQLIWSWTIDVDGYLCLMMGGNPSGSFNTLSDNSLALILTLLYHIGKQSDSLEELLQKAESINCAMFGDDSVLPDCAIVSGYEESAKEIGFDIGDELPSGPLETGIFLNSGFHFEDSMWFPKPSFDKIRANIYFDFKRQSWRLCYVKCCAYRILAWKFRRYRQEAETLIDWIYTNKLQYIKTESVIDPLLTEKSALAAYLPASQVEFMYTGNESINLLEGLVENDLLKRFLHFPLLM